MNGRMSRILDLALPGHPDLRVVAEPVQDVCATPVQNLVSDLIATMLHHQAVGLAAPQVMLRQRVFVMQSKPSPRHPGAPELAPFALINPELVAADDSTVLGWEGCGSMPGYFGVVRRSIAISCRWVAADGSTVQSEMRGLPARIFLHELDHLDGIMFIDRLESVRHLVCAQERDRRGDLIRDSKV